MLQKCWTTKKYWMLVFKGCFFLKMKWTFYTYSFLSLFLSGNISFSLIDIDRMLCLRNIRALCSACKILSCFNVKQIYYSPIDFHSVLVFTMHKIPDKCLIRSSSYYRFTLHALSSRFQMSSDTHFSGWSVSVFSTTP